MLTYIAGHLNPLKARWTAIAKELLKAQFMALVFRVCKIDDNSTLYESDW